MGRRYEAYKDVVVRPFFRDHFARLDRQIVLVDALAALQCRAGRGARSRSARWPAFSTASGSGAARSLSSAVPRRAIDRILFAATKADHLHHSSHDRLEAILAAHGRRARPQRAEFAGAAIDVVALAAVRATREAQVARGRRQAARRSSARRARRDRRRRDLRRRDRGRDLSRRPAGRSGSAVRRRRRVSRTLQRASERGRFPLPALPAAAARTRPMPTSPRCRTSASTARSSS